MKFLQKIVDILRTWQLPQKERPCWDGRASLPNVAGWRWGMADFTSACQLP